MKANRIVNTLCNGFSTPPFNDFIKCVVEAFSNGGSYTKILNRRYLWLTLFIAT